MATAARRRAVIGTTSPPKIEHNNVVAEDEEGSLAARRRPSPMMRLIWHFKQQNKKASGLLLMLLIGLLAILLGLVASLVRQSILVVPGSPQRQSPHYAQPRLVFLSTSHKLISSLKQHINATLSTSSHHSIHYNPLPLRKGSEKKQRAASPVDHGECKVVADWQYHSRPNCNVLHEITYLWHTDVLARMPARKNRLLTEGAYRHVWKIVDTDAREERLQVLKLLNIGEEDAEDALENPRHVDRHRRDAIAYEVLTHSPLVPNAYGHCVHSALFDYAPDGDMFAYFDDKEPNTLSGLELLRIAQNVSQAVAHFHCPDAWGRPTMAHTDIKPDQFLFVDGYFHLTDFNRVRFLQYKKVRDPHATSSLGPIYNSSSIHNNNNNNNNNNSTLLFSKACGFTLGANGGRWRSPEEYAFARETEKVDIFSVGYIYYFLLTGGTAPWHGWKSKALRQEILAGRRAPYDNTTALVQSRAGQVLQHAMEWAQQQEAKARPSAQQLADYFAQEIKKLSR